MKVVIKEMQHHVSPVGFWGEYDFWDCKGTVNGKFFDAVFDSANGRMTIPKGYNLGLTVEELYRLVAIVRNKFQAAAYGVKG